MGDFASGIDVENNMLSEMSQRSDGLAQHYQDELTNYNNLLTNTREKAKGEVEALSTPQALGEDLTQVAQVGERTAAARSTLRNVYGSNKLAYLKGLGRTGEETTLGVRPLAQAISKRVGTIRATPELSTAVEQPTEINVSGTSSEPPPQPSSGEGGSAPEGAAVSEGTAAESSTGIPAVETATTRTAASTADAVAEGSNAAAEGLGATARAGLSTAADLGAKAGVGLGIIGGAVSATKDFSGGHFHLAGDNTAEKAGNAMSMASGALDTLGLVAPPLAILGGILGVGSAIADIFGHEKDASEKVQAVQGKSPPPPKALDMTAASTAVGQVASQGADTLHSISGTTF